MPKTAAFIEENRASKVKPDKPQAKHPRSPIGKTISPDVGKETQFKPGVSGNPGGIRKGDTAKRIAKRVFDDHEEQIYLAMLASVLNGGKGNAYSFKEIAERGFGKLKETKEVTHVHQDVPDADLNRQIAELERKLGLAAAIDDAGRVGLAAAGTSKTNGHAKTEDILS